MLITVFELLLYKPLII